MSVPDDWSQRSGVSNSTTEFRVSGVGFSVTLYWGVPGPGGPCVPGRIVRLVRSRVSVGDPSSFSDRKRDPSQLKSHV